MSKTCSYLHTCKILKQNVASKWFNDTKQIILECVVHITTIDPSLPFSKSEFCEWFFRFKIDASHFSPKLLFSTYFS